MIGEIFLRGVEFTQLTLVTLSLRVPDTVGVIRDVDLYGLQPPADHGFQEVFLPN